MKGKFLLMLLVIGVFAVSAQAVVIQIQPWWGNNITNDSPNQNYQGGNAMIYHNSGSRIDRQLQWYDLDAYEGQTVISASYTFSAREIWDFSNTNVELREITQSWHKNTVNWNNQPTIGGVLGNLTGMGGTGEGLNDIITRTIPVSSIQPWLNNKNNNLGWMMKLTDAQETDGIRNGMNMRSFAYGTHELGPYLTLEIVPEPATMILLGLGGLVIRRRRK